MSDKRSIGVFAAKREEDTAVFFGCDDQTMVARLYEKASNIARSSDLPITAPGKVRRIGKLSLSKVDDDCDYIVEPIEMPDTDRTPSGEAGTWTAQSVIFDKDMYTLDEAKIWIAEHSDNFGNFGNDETDTAYRFRQFDPSHFDEFRTTSLTDGVAVVYGKIAEEATDDEAAKASVELSIERFYAVRKINQSILKQGVMILCGSAKSVITKGDDDVDKEERYVLSMVLEPNDGENGAPDKPDTQDDVYSHDDVRRACHVWMEYYGAVDLMHSWKALGKQDVRTLECYLAPCDFELGDDKVIKGSWMLAVRVANDELWAAVKEGKLGAYSIGGTANRVPLDSV